jgi:hypothetical protein
MSERRATYDEQLPWLQAVEDEESPRGMSARKMLALVLVVMAGAALVAGSFFFLGRQDPVQSGGPELIRAEPGPYKVKPVDPGGLDVAGESETAFQTSAGEDQDAQLDLPANSAPALPTPEPAKPDAAVSPAAKPSEPAAAPTPSGTIIQLGAFANSGQAERAWAALSSRFPAVASLNKMVVPFSGGVRLRASGGSAKEACEAVRAGGENCFVAVK